MTPEQEIRMRVLELKANNIVHLAAACIIANRNFNGDGLWKDGELEEFVEYVKTGKKPECAP